MAKERVLIVEDDRDVLKLVTYNMEKSGFECTPATSGEEALDALEEHPFDLIILDLMLPEIDGLEVCRQVKQDRRLSSIPVIMLTARGEEVDRIVGFELGADDYVVKPFSPRELVLRAKAVIRRHKTPEQPGEILGAGKLEVDISRHKVTVEGRPIRLTPLEFRLLVTLLKRKGRVQTRERLSTDVWDMSSDIATRTIDTHIKRLRQKLGKAGRMIETVRGMGYRFSEEG